MENFGLLFKRYEFGKIEDWLKIADEIPALNFKPDWNVKIIPPFGGATSRFTVEKSDKKISVYFDAFSWLGRFDNKPYWEAYQLELDYLHDDNEPVRFAANETKELIEYISSILDGEKNESV